MNPRNMSIFYKIASCICFLAMNVIVKSIKLPAEEIGSIESLAGACVLWPWCRSFPMEICKQPLYWIRALVALGGTLLWIYALKNLPLFQSIAMGFMSPFFTVLGAHFVLHEIMTRHRVTAIILATMGGFLVSHGSRLWSLTLFFQEVSFRDIIILTPTLASACFACVNIMSKLLLKKSTPAILSFSLLLTTGVGLLSTLFTWRMPDTIESLKLLTLAGFASLAHLFLHAAMQHADLTMLLPIGAIRLLLSAFLGWLFFQEYPTLWMICGVLIIGFSLYILKKEPLK